MIKQRCLLFLVFGPLIRGQDTSNPPSKSPTFASDTMVPSGIPDFGGDSQLPSLMPSSIAPMLAPIISSQAPSSFPSSGPTALPSMSPSSGPSLGPTLSPSIAPSVAPSIAPSIAPSVGPSIAPSVGLSIAPSSKPSISPVSSVPSVGPTVDTVSLFPSLGDTSSNPWMTESLAPSTLPSDFPSSIPTPSPTAPSATSTPTNPPSISSAPSSKGTSAAPTTSPTTESPTKTPTMQPFTESPTVSPVTSNPTGKVSSEPTTASVSTPEPTPAATVQVDDTVDGLKMMLSGLSAELSDAALESWTKTTEDFIVTYFESNPALGVSIASTTITSVSQNFVSGGSRRLLRGLQGGTSDSLEITYSQAATYSHNANSEFTIDSIVTSAFNEDTIEEYAEQLRQGDVAFQDVATIAPVEIQAPPDDEPEEDDNSDMLLIILIAGGGVIVVVIGAAICFMFMGDDSSGYVSTSKAPPSNLDVGNTPDEVSTIADPTAKVGGPTSNESLAGYGDQSVATVDYDYSQAYGGGGDTSVSSAGGTFGSHTHARSAGGAAISTGGPLDPTGYGGTETGSQFRGQNANVREELVDIFAPPGKLGVVIDTPDDGAPVVHAVKDSSVIADKLQVGDKLVAVDDEDVRSMTAIKVSKLISRKSANASRKLTIIRTVVVGE